jgi:hypothetical protein
MRGGLAARPNDLPWCFTAEDAQSMCRVSFAHRHGRRVSVNMLEADASYRRIIQIPLHWSRGLEDTYGTQ